ncbi:MAG: toluene hydroxylase [Kineosporiaceae bacterium]|nr:toluene hydroxylase [Kineosporiaceae bacterium]MBK7621510.1 toluene hydroxylase [Kineosporiaceae bacterium]MBK8077326.1 toluene hydroxylase [Kineosporiaceae bacterium]
MAVTRRTPPKTWSLLGEVRRRPSVYEVTAAKFNYHFRREPAPFEMDPTAAINLWYLEHREGSAFNVADWEGFRDPAKLTYSDYVNLQHERETYLDLLIDHHELVGSVDSLDPAWVATLTRLLVPMRFPLHVLQMTGLYVGQMSPSAFIINCANFQAADEMRRIQRLAYLTKMMANAHGDDIAATATARDPWQSDAAWQPLREAAERMLGVYDWGESFTALNLALKPAVDSVVNEQLTQLAIAHSDEFLALLLAEFQRDTTRSQNWTAALVQYALGADPALADTLRGWLDVHVPRADAAVAGIAELFATAPNPVPAGQVIEAAGAARGRLLAACGL